MRIIPAIDIIDGKCVRLAQGDYDRQTTYNEDPLEVAQAFEDAGIKYLHLVDLDGARSKQIVNWKVLERLAGRTNLVIDFGGGIKSDHDIHIAFESGASQVTAGSIAAENRSKFISWLATYGPDRLILGADAKDGKIASQEWQKQTELPVTDFIAEYLELGVEYVISTDIAKDGMLDGPSFDLYSEILSNNSNIKLIASGGVTSIDDIYKLLDMQLEGAIIGKAIYEGAISLKELEAVC